MARENSVRIHEVAFCGEIKSYMDSLFVQHTSWPFSRAAIEEYGKGNNKRQDLRVYDRNKHTPVLCGEVKLPGTPEGRSPYDPALMQDAFNKADNIQAPYFFTWNVNTLVLFDRSKWQVPMIQRRIKEWNLGFRLTRPEDCRKPEIQHHIRDKFLPAFLQEFSEIVKGTVKEWGMPPDDIFIKSLESHLDWPVIGTRDFLAVESQRDQVFASRLYSWMAEEMQWTFDPSNAEDMDSVLERAARTLCYVFCNRAIFYEAIRSRYPDSLAQLSLPSNAKKCEQIYDYFRNHFERAILETGDYEPIFYPHVQDWAGALVFASPVARQGWEGVFINLAEYNFREIAYDIIGGIFQKLISPEERQKFGQFYTNEDIVDVINAFCIRRGGDVVLDPACGSGSFLVRAYYRKAWLSEHNGAGQRHQDTHKYHQELLREIYGCDIALFAAHLATLNLASRHIEDEANYPCIARGNYFEVAENPASFCVIPCRPPTADPAAKRVRTPVELPELDAVIGNPPYVRQELIAKKAQIKKAKGEDRHSYESRLKNTKEHFQELCARFWPGMKLSGRSDLHCYFWPVAAKSLKEKGRFGFLTSSSWLDVEYGFALQAWILQNFRIIAIIESMDEPWFEDARVKTAVTILQRCSDPEQRDETIVKFVRLQKPVRNILGYREHGDEGARQAAAEKLRDFIEKRKGYFEDDQMRIIPVPQKTLWEEGVLANALLSKSKTTEPAEDDEAEENEGDSLAVMTSDYAAGKWGRFLRAPRLYFRLLDEYSERFIKLGEIAEIKFGIKSGCDAFFMPVDVTDKILAQTQKGLIWNNVGLMTPCKRSEIESGKVRIIQAGDKTLHPIEVDYIRPEVHSLMQVSRPVIYANELNRVVLWVNQPLSDLKGTYAAKYIRWGAAQTFESKKSKAVPVPQRSSCASRPLWYDLTNASTGGIFWPMAQKYRHIVAGNPESLVCNHNLFYIKTKDINKTQEKVLTSVLNGTLLSLLKHFYGRYAGSEGTLKTEVVDTVLIEIPDPRCVTNELSKKLLNAYGKMCEREVTHLVADSFLECHSVERMRELLAAPFELPAELQQKDRRELDDAVFELLGEKDAAKRAALIDELYTVTTEYYRYQRTQDIQSMENRAGQSRQRIGAADLAGSIWDSLETADKQTLQEFLETLPGERHTVTIHEGKAKAFGASHLFEPSAVEYTTQKQKVHVEYENPPQAELVALLSDLGIHGTVQLPKSPKVCMQWSHEINEAIRRMQNTFESFASTRTGTARIHEQILTTLMNWFIHGKGN